MVVRCLSIGLAAGSLACTGVERPLAPVSGAAGKPSTQLATNLPCRTTPPAEESIGQTNTATIYVYNNSCHSITLFFNRAPFVEAGSIDAGHSLEVGPAVLSQPVCVGTATSSTPIISGPCYVVDGGLIPLKVFIYSDPVPDATKAAIRATIPAHKLVDPKFRIRGNAQVMGVRG